jgi:hypothetical protein
MPSKAGIIGPLKHVCHCKKIIYYYDKLPRERVPEKWGQRQDNQHPCTNSVNLLFRQGPTVKSTRIQFNKFDLHVDE